MGKRCGHSPLFIALVNNHVELAKVLVEQGAQTSGAGIDGLGKVKHGMAVLDRLLQYAPKEQKVLQPEQKLYDLVWHLMKQKNFDGLGNILSTIQVDDVKNLMTSGRLPLEGWNELWMISAATDDALAPLKQESAHIESRIKSLEEELAELRSRSTELQQEIEQKTKVAHLAEILQVCSTCELELVRAHQETIASANWNLDQMSWNDLIVALQKFHVPQWVPRLSNSEFIDQQVDTAFHYDYTMINNEFPDASLEEKLDLLYVLDMISSQQFDEDKHNENCPVCSCENVELYFREYGVAKELFDRIRDRVTNLKLNRIIFWHVNSLEADLDLDSRAKGKIARAMGNIKAIHSSNSI